MHLIWFEIHKLLEKRKSKVFNMIYFIWTHILHFYLLFLKPFIYTTCVLYLLTIIIKYGYQIKSVQCKIYTVCIIVYSPVRSVIRKTTLPTLSLRLNRKGPDSLFVQRFVKIWLLHLQGWLIFQLFQLSVTQNK